MDECALYTDPQLYDLLFPSAGGIDAASDESRRERIVASERFYFGRVGLGGGRVLELACGSGRLTIPLAQSGFDIIGVDISHSMIEAARAKAHLARVPVRFIHADIRNFDLQEQFSTILIPGNSLLHLLTTDELLQCLICVRRHLSSTGSLVFDIAKFDPRRLASEPGQRDPVLRLIHPQYGEVTIDETSTYDAAAQIRHVTWYLSTPGAPDFRTIDYPLRVIFPQELLLLLNTAGFHLDARYGEFTGIPFDSSSPRQVCICSMKPHT